MMFSNTGAGPGHKLRVFNGSGYESTLCLVFTQAQLNKVLRLGIGKLDGTLVIAFRVSHCLELERQGITFLKAWDLLTDSDLENCARQGDRLAECWHKPFEKDLIYKSHCIPEVDESSLRFLFQDSVYLKVFFERLTRLITVRRCVLISSFDQPIEFHPQETEIHSCLIAYFCVRMGIPTVIIPLPAPQSFHYKNRIPKIARTAVQNLTFAARSLKEAESAPGGQPRKIGILTDVINDYLSYIKVLSSAGVDLVGFSLWDDLVKIDEMHSNNCKFVPLGIPHNNSIGSKFKKMFQTAHEKFKRSDAVIYQDYADIFRNQWLEFQFRHIFLRRWPQLCHFVDHTEQVLSSLKLDALITAAYDVPESIILVGEAKKLGIPVVAVPHSSNLELGRPWTEVDKIGVIMEHHVPLTPFDQSRFEVIGSPKHFLQRINRRRSMDPKKIKSELGLPLGKKLILAITNSFYEGLTPFVNPTETVTWMEQMANVPSALHDKVAVIWKSKNRADDSVIYQHLVAENNRITNNIVLSPATEFDKLAYACDVAVGINCWTTGFMDVVLMERPLVLTGKSLDLGNQAFYGNYIIPTEGIPVVQSHGELWGMLESVLFDNNMRLRLILAQGAALKESMPMDDTGSNIRNLMSRIMTKN